LESALAGTYGILGGKTLIEVGSTRERDPRRGSTEKPAIFTGLKDNRFITGCRQHCWAAT
jgi:hypothetical protein